MLVYPMIVADILQYYADPILHQTINLDSLAHRPTHQISHKLKELITDVALVGKLVANPHAMVLVLFENKSRPERGTRIQIGTYVMLELHTFQQLHPNKPLPIIVPIYLYHGKQESSETDPPHIDELTSAPGELIHGIPKIGLWKCNLRRFDMKNLPGRPLTRMFVESLLRGTDGTLGNHLGTINHFQGSSIDDMIEVVIQKFLTYADCVSVLDDDVIQQHLTEVFDDEEAIKMTRVLQKKWRAVGLEEGRAEGRELGIAEGKAEGKAETLFLFLNSRFGFIPESLVKSIQGISNLDRLDKLVSHVAKCDSLESFMENFAQK